TEPQVVWLWIGRAVGRAGGSIQNIAERRRRPIKVGKVKHVVESHPGAQLYCFFNLVGPTQPQVETLQPALPNSSGRGQLQRAECAATSTHIATDDAAQLLKLCQRHQTLIDQDLTSGRGLADHAVVEAGDFLVQTVDTETASESANVRSRQQVTRPAIRHTAPVTGAVAGNICLENSASYTRYGQRNIRGKRAIEVSNQAQAKVSQ